MLPVVIGAVIGRLYERRAAYAPDPAFAKRLGVLTATGLIVGESLFGVAFAGVVALTGQSAPLALVGPAYAPIGLLLGVAIFVVVAAGLYRHTAAKADLPHG